MVVLLIWKTRLTFRFLVSNFDVIQKKINILDVLKLLLESWKNVMKLVM